MSKTAEANLVSAVLIDPVHVIEGASRAAKRIIKKAVCKKLSRIHMQDFNRIAIVRDTRQGYTYSND